MKSEEEAFEIMLLGGEYNNKMYDPTREFTHYYYHFQNNKGEFLPEKLGNYIVKVLDDQKREGLNLSLSEEKINSLVNRIISLMQSSANAERKLAPHKKRRKVLPLAKQPCGCCYAIESELRGFMVHE